MNFSSPVQMVTFFARKRWRRIVLVFFTLLLVTLTTALQPLVMAPLINIAMEGENLFAAPEYVAEHLVINAIDLNNVDKYVAQFLGLNAYSPWEVVLILCGLYLLLVVAAALFQFTQYYVSQTIRFKAGIDLEKNVFAHMLDLSLDYFSKNKSGEMVVWLQANTNNAVATFVDILSKLLISPLMILFYGYMLAKTNYTLTVLVATTAIAQWSLARMMRRVIQDTTRAQFDIFAEANGYLQEVFQNIREVKSFVAEGFEKSRFSQLMARYYATVMRFVVFKHGVEPIELIITGLTNIAMLLLVIRELFAGSLTFAGFFLYLYIGRSILPHVSALSQSYIRVQEMEALSQKILDVFKTSPSITSGSKRITNFNHKIEFINVSFSYGDEIVLKNINLEIRRGELTALIGPSGAGKSTLTDLLMRFYDPTEGKILVDGVDLREINIESYRGLFGIVAQDNLLFNASVADNISYGLTDIPIPQIQLAAEIANAASFIDGMPEGYDTVIGDRGVRLSGGQRQRIAIARAVLRSPELLILDEATSSLDSKSEKLVQDAIDRIVQETSAVVIAHRLSTVIHAQKIVVLNEGKIEDQGKHDELLQRSTLYRNLCELQFGQALTERD